MITLNQQAADGGRLGADCNQCAVIGFQSVLVDVACCISEGTIGHEEFDVLCRQTTLGREVNAVDQVANLDQIADSAFVCATINLDVATDQIQGCFCEGQLQCGFFSSFECAQVVYPAQFDCGRLCVHGKAELVAGLQVGVGGCVFELASANRNGAVHTREQACAGRQSGGEDLGRQARLRNQIAQR